ncbi:MAG: DUF4190 domain-containing protein [Verrucomicrobia bacterium]|nr:DUF4190 domain-containing protein [Verrucomicrobiota bacterium]
MYKILGTDQKEYEPVSADQVRQWIADGRAAGQTKAQAEGTSEWKALAEFQEFAEALAAKTTPSPVLSAPPLLPTKRPPASGLAITSLVLGALSLVCLSIFTGIPAIITGHIAYNRSRKNPLKSGGGGLAIAGFVLGYVSLAMLPIFAAMLLPTLAKAKGNAQRIQCVNNLKQIGLAARIWAMNHGDKFPPDFKSMSNELGTPKILVCPGDGAKTPAANWAGFGPGNVSYEYVEPGYDEKSGDAQAVVFECPIHGSTGLGDGSVQGGLRTRRFKR